jgi:hypothetical protein
MESSLQMDIKSLPTRFREKFILPENLEDCWIWTAGRFTDGYGSFRGDDGNVTSAHRYAFTKLRDSIPDGFELHHKCRRPDCVNPNHLEVLSPLEHAATRLHAKTHCPQGHEYTEANSYYYKGNRACRACNKFRQQFFTRRANRLIKRRQTI